MSGWVVISGLWGYSIGEMQEDMDILNGRYEEVKRRMRGLNEKMVLSRLRSKELLLILKEKEGEIPIWERSKGGNEYSYYEGRILLYRTKEGEGIRIGYEEDLFQKGEEVRYQLRDEYEYSRLKKEGVFFEFLREEGSLYWVGGDRRGLKGVMGGYRYHARNGLDGKLIFEKVIMELGIDRIFMSREGLDLTYKLRGGNFYKVFKKGNIVMGKNFKGKIFKEEDKEAINFLLRNFSQTRYVDLLNRLLEMKVRLNNSGLIYTVLVNGERGKYGLELLKWNWVLHKIAKAHRHYLASNKSKNLHWQSPKGVGYFGRTIFQRRKAYGYENRVREKIIFGDDPIYCFIKVLGEKFWMDHFLDPRSMELGYYGLGGLGILLLGWR